MRHRHRLSIVESLRGASVVLLVRNKPPLGCTIFGWPSGGARRISLPVAVAINKEVSNTMMDDFAVPKQIHVVLRILWIGA